MECVWGVVAVVGLFFFVVIISAGILNGPCSRAEEEQELLDRLVGIANEK